MNEKELKTSPKQRIVITLIAVVMLGSIIASYAAIILNGGKSSSGDTENKISEEKIMEYENAYNELLAKFKTATQGDFNKFIQYKSEITAYNEASANEGPVTTKDLAIGDGEEITADNSNYYAYYVGWCADESIFDSSFDDNNNPQSFAKILDASLGMIEGWTTGVVGMRINGIRVITVPGTLAYGSSMEICGGYNKPLKFMIMAKRKSEERTKMATELDTAFTKYQYALYGIDYDAQF
jgi:FKBP-type peptidyl-prolyl cis-trans isomerase